MKMHETARTRYLEAATGAISMTPPEGGYELGCGWVEARFAFRDPVGRVAADYFDLAPTELDGAPDFWVLYLDGNQTWLFQRQAPAIEHKGETHHFSFVLCNIEPSFKTIDEAADALARATYLFEYTRNTGYEEPTWELSANFMEVLPK
jgi:hypothetical protein